MYFLNALISVECEKSLLQITLKQRLGQRFLPRLTLFKELYNNFHSTQFALENIRNMIKV